MDDAVLAEVIRGAQRGDEAAFDRLVSAYGRRIVGFLYRLTSSREEADDLAQEVFVRIVRTIASYRHDGRFEPWLFRIAANLARDRVRRLQRMPKIIPLETGDGSPGKGSAASDRLESPTEPVEAAMMHREAVERLNRALAELPEAEREVLMLRHFSRMSFREISKATGSPLGTALARSHRGLARLRETMTRLENHDNRHSDRSEETDPEPLPIEQEP